MSLFQQPQNVVVTTPKLELSKKNYGHLTLAHCGHAPLRHCGHAPLRHCGHNG